MTTRCAKRSPLTPHPLAVKAPAWVPAILCAVGAVLTWAFVRDPEQPGPDPAVAGDPPPGELNHHRHHRRFHL